MKFELLPLLFQKNSTQSICTLPYTMVVIMSLEEDVLTQNEALLNLLGGNHAKRIAMK
jgi:hypothetical protein